MPELTFSELSGYLIESPIRGAIAVTLLDNGELPELAIAERVITQLSELRLLKRPLLVRVPDVLDELANLHAAGIVEPFAKEGSVWYRFTETGYKVADVAMEPLPWPKKA